jgi:P pilus assembly chaperone PapD
MFRFAPRIIALSLASISMPALAGGDLLVAPTRVVLDGPRGTEVFLNNVGAQPATYRISMELKRMLPSGQVEDVAPEAATEKEKSTLSMITYAPRRVTLAPNQPQAVRIGVRPPANLPDGEYRAHILFRAIPDTSDPKPAAAAPPQGLSIALTPIYGVTIPIIIRKGSLKVTAAISGIQKVRIDPTNNEIIAAKPKAKPGDAPAVDAISFTLARSGDRSTYGRIRVSKPGVAKPIYEARGIAVYTEVSSRVVTLPIPPEVAAQLSGPTKVEYLEDNDTGGGMIAEAQVVIR